MGDPPGVPQVGAGPLVLDAAVELAAVQVEGDLVERGPAEVAVGYELLDEAFEGQLGLGEGVLGGAGDGVQGLGEGPGAVEAAAEHEAAEEEADDAFEFGQAAAGHRGADGQVPLAAVTGQYGRVRGQQGHERGGAVALAQGGEPGDDVGGDVEEGGGALAVADRGAGPVGGQGQLGCSVQLCAPVRQDRGEDGLGEAAALPGRVVGVLDGEGGQDGAERVGTAQRGLGQQGELALQDAAGPAVGGDVVHGQAEDLAAVLGADEEGAQQRAVFQVEAVGAVGGEQGAGLAGGGGGGADLDADGRVDDLQGFAVGLDVAGPQRLVAGGQGVDDLLDGVRAASAGTSSCTQETQSGPWGAIRSRNHMPRWP